MNIIIKTKNIELTESLNSLIIRKIGGLKKFVAPFEGHSLPMAAGRSLFDIFVEVGQETRHHQKGEIYKTDLKIYLPGKSLFATSKGDDLIRTILDARDELESEIRKYKSKVVEFPRRQAKKKAQADNFQE